MLHFRLFGFPFYIHGFFWIASAILGGAFGVSKPHEWIFVAVWVAIVLVSVSIHELGHALVARHFGCQPSIILHSLGGLTTLEGASLSRKQHIAVSFAGPIFGLLLGALTWVVAERVPIKTDLAAYTVAQLLFVNFIWSIFNLLPILPMDGGQILRDILGPKRLRTSELIGGVVAIAAALGLLAISQWFAAILLVLMAVGNFRSQRMQGGVERG